MNPPRITGEAARYVLERAQTDASHETIARELEQRFDLVVSSRAVGRMLAVFNEQVDRSPAEAPLEASEADPGAAAVDGDDTAPAVEPTLDEIPALEAQALKLQRLLAGRLPHKDRAALNGELRQTFNSIRKAQAAKQAAKDGTNEDTTWVIAKLKRFEAMNAKVTTKDGSGSGGAGVPPAPRAANGE